MEISLSDDRTLYITAPEQGDFPREVWAVTALNHEGVRDYESHCRWCIDCIEKAITYGSALGASSNTYTDNSPEGVHSASVQRIIGFVA